jgi:hypothetical protein
LAFWLGEQGIDRPQHSQAEQPALTAQQPRLQAQQQHISQAHKEKRQPISLYCQITPNKEKKKRGRKWFKMIKLEFYLKISFFESSDNFCLCYLGLKIISFSFLFFSFSFSLFSFGLFLSVFFNVCSFNLHKVSSAMVKRVLILIFCAVVFW